MNLYINLPVGDPNAAGDYRVDPAKLSRMIAPCLTHTLDSTFSALVIEELHAHGIRDIVAIHDAWLISSDALPALYDAVEVAGGAWLRRLGPVYDALVDALKGHAKYRRWAERLRARWQFRVDRRDWPHFRVEPLRLTEITSSS
jgi:hypothetical protein